MSKVLRSVRRMVTTSRITCLAAVLAALTLAALRANAAAPVQFRWEVLPGAVVGKTVMVALPGGPVITGKVTGVTPDALLVDVRSTTDAKAYPKGPASLPRATLRVFQLRTKGKAFRIVGTVIGAAAGLLAGGLAALGIEGGFFSNDHPHLSLVAFIGISAGGTAAGYFVGNAADKRWTTVEIIQ